MEKQVSEDEALLLEEIVLFQMETENFPSFLRVQLQLTPQKNQAANEEPCSQTLTKKTKKTTKIQQKVIENLSMLEEEDQQNYFMTFELSILKMNRLLQNLILILIGTNDFNCCRKKKKRSFEP